MSMRRHRASLFVEQSVFYLADLKKQKKNLYQIKLMTFLYTFYIRKMEFSYT